MFGGGAVAGGISVANQQEIICKKTQELTDQIQSLTTDGKKILKQYQRTNIELRKNIAAKQQQILDTTKELLDSKKSYETTYQMSQWFAGGIFLFVAIALYLKHQKVLTIDPVSV